MAAAWLGSEAFWFVVLNAVVAAIAVLSYRTRRAPLSTPRRGGGGARVSRRASSAVLQSLRSFSSSIFSFPSACLSYLQPDAAAAAPAAGEETEEPVVPPSPAAKPSPPRAPALAPPSSAAPAEDEDEDEDEDDPNAMSMDEAYALVLASRQRPEREREEDARQSEVDARADEFIRGFKDELRQQRLNSIFNYTQMLKQRALGGGGRQPEARPDQL